MKSIKEKAKESDRIVERISPNVSIVDVSGRRLFEAGANYVLDEIEKLINNQNWCAFPASSHKELKDLIEQLKEK